MTLPFGANNEAIDSLYLSNGKLNVGVLEYYADLLLKGGEFMLAKNIYKSMLRSGENSSLALLGIGKVLEAEGRVEEAICYYEKSIAYQASLAAYRCLIRIFLKRKKDEKAITFFERALTIKDLSSKDRFYLTRSAANIYVKVNNLDQAERLFKICLELEPTSDEVRTNLGFVFLNRGDRSEAKRCFVDSIASNSKNSKAMIGLGIVLYEQDDFDSAFQSIYRALLINLNDPCGIFYFLKCVYILEKFEQGEAVLKEFVDRFPVTGSILYSLAGIQFQLGHFAECRDSVDRVLRIDPSHPGARELKEVLN